MQQVFRLSVAAVAAVAFVYLAGFASAQVPIKQIKLSEKHIEGFIAAHKDMADAIDKTSSEKSDATAQAELDTVAKKFGFKDYNEYEDVITNISMVVYGIDPKTMAFTDPPTQAKRELDEAIANKSLPENEKKQLVEELTEQWKAMQPIMHPSNVDLVKKHYGKLAPLLQ